MKAEKKSLLAEPPMQLVLAFLAGAFLSWPIIQIAAAGGTSMLFAYLFTVWGGLVALLWRIGRAIGGRPAAAEPAAEPVDGAAPGEAR